jgi:carbon storage regulator
MLILTRKVDQGIVIQGNIVVTVLRVERDRVKLGISAPEEITVLREELLQRNGGWNKRESQANPGNKDLPPLPRLRFSGGPGAMPSEGPPPDTSDGN